MGIEKLILADCNICEKTTVFEYLAVFSDKDMPKIKPFLLYNCKKCHGTKAYQSLKVREYMPKPDIHD